MEQKEDVDWQDKNMRAGRRVILNALQCLKRGGSSHDFLAMNGKSNGCDTVPEPTKKLKPNYFLQV